MGVLPDYPLSDLEIKARITVERYSDVAGDARNLWNEIKQTHPASQAKSHAKYSDYNNLREERDSIASVIAESKKLYNQFFKENNVKWQSIETGNKAHYDRQLHNVFVSNLSKEEKDAYNIVKSYIEAKNNVIAFVAHFKDRNQKQDRDLDQGQKNAKIFNFPDKQEYQLYNYEKITRDELALKLVENHHIYEKYWQVANVNTDSLLEHAIKGEEQKLAQTKEQDQRLQAEIARRNEILPGRSYMSLAKAIASDMYYQKQIEREVNPGLKQVYKDPEVVKENWQKLELKHCFEKAIQLVKTNPEIVGQIRGNNILGFKDEARKQANINKFAIHVIFGIYSEAQNAKTTRQEIEDYSQDKAQKALSKININQNYDQLLGQITKINTKLIPSLENKVTNQVIQNASIRMMEYIIDHKTRHNQEPSLNEMKSFFYRSKFEAIRFKQLQDKISKDQSLQDYFKQMQQVNRQVNIEGKLFAKDYVQNGYKQPLKIDYHSGNITFHFNQYQTEAAKELSANNKELPLMTKMVENSYAENSFIKAGVQDMTVLLSEYKEKFGSMPNTLQQDCMKNIISNQVKPNNVTHVDNINYLHKKEITEIYSRSLWQSDQDKRFKLDKLDRNRDDYLQIEEKSKANNLLEYSLTKFELDKEAKQTEQELEKQFSKESVKEIGER